MHRSQAVIDLPSLLSLTAPAEPQVQTQTMTYKPRQADIDAYNIDGAVPLRGVVGDADMQRLADAVEDDIRAPGPFYHGYESDEGRFHGNMRLWETHETFRDICLNSDLPGIARAFLGGSKTNLLYDQLFIKEAAMSQRTRWHNDQPYWPIRGWQVLSIWIALDETSDENGRLEFIRGSHRWDRWFQPEVFGKTDAITQYERNPEFEDIPDIEADRDSYDIVSWDLEPGDACLFHGMTVHGAGGNQASDRRRRGYTIRYTGDDVVYDVRPGLSPPLVCEDLEPGEPLDSERYPVVARVT
jgi:ectoine hydroxylase-related dioxygenase (phytanoyl-CoA dioxygenase family)